MKRSIISVSLLSLVLSSCDKPESLDEAKIQVNSITTIANIADGVVPIESLNSQSIFRTVTGDDLPNKYNPFQRSVEQATFIDFWGTPIEFFRDEEDRIVAWSAGPDRAFSKVQGGGDDVLGGDSYRGPFSNDL